MLKPYHVYHDPVYYVIVAFFALLTTAAPALMGQPRFMPFTQTVALFVFLAIVVRNQALIPALRILAIWLVVQLIVLTVVTRLAPNQVEHAIREGFAYRSASIAWLHGAQSLPASLLSAPFSRFFEVVGVLLGSLLTGGFLGVWLLIRGANLAGYAAGAFWQDSHSLATVFAGLAPWVLLRLAGYMGFVALLAEPLLTSNWSLRYYLSERRQPLRISTAMLLVGLLLELLLPGLWRTLLQPLATP
jgi:hypothetical protein